jgi:hypothetical protein
VVITEKVPGNTPFDPPFISDELTPIGGFVKPGNDETQKSTGQLFAAIYLGVPGAPGLSEQLCYGFGSTIMNSTQFGWTLGFRQGSGGALEPVIGDNATGLTNKIQVRRSCLAKVKCILSSRLEHAILHQQQQQQQLHVAPVPSAV